MCKLSINSDAQERLLGVPPKAISRLTWAVPVDIVELVSRLQAIYNLEPQITLISQEREEKSGLLARLPKEILDLVTDEMIRQEQAGLRHDLSRMFTCFTERCTFSRHWEHDPGCIFDLWDFFYVQERANPLDPSMYTVAEKATMMEKDLGERMAYVPHYEYDHSDMHKSIRAAWIQKTCRCENRPRNAVATTKDGAFVSLNNILKKQFGLEALIIHEIMSDELREFLPDIHGRQLLEDDCGAYHSIAFLVPVSPSESHPQLMPRANDCGYRMGHREIVEPSSLVLTVGLQQQFTKALNALKLRPSFHLTELHSLISHPIQNPILRDICCCYECREMKPFGFTNRQATVKLQEYLSDMNRVRANEKWPKLMLISPSQVVEPDGA